MTLAPGAYTAIVSSASGSTSGTALVEIYDVSGGASGQRLVNLSTRAVAGTGVNTLVTGLFISGSQPKRILFRAAGPALTALGVSNALARPSLAVYRGSTLIAQNVGWATGGDASVIAPAAAEAGAFAFAPNSADSALLLNLPPEAGAFAFAPNSADSALLLNLPPGLYTAHLASPDAALGTALIEIYEVP
jgi:hypothetical protein